MSRVVATGNQEIEKTRQDNAALSSAINDLKKTILKLVFSYAGLDPDIDGEIQQLKARLKVTGNETEKRAIIQETADRVLQSFEKVKAKPDNQKDASDSLFTDFLDRLSLPGDLENKISELRDQAKDIQQKQEYLELLDKTVEIICQASDGKDTGHEYLVTLLEHITLPKDESTRLIKIRNQISAGEASNLTEVSKNISLVINDANSRLQGELDSIRHYLNRLIGQLSVLYGHLQSTQREQSLSCMEAESLNSNFKQQSSVLKHEMEEARDLESLKSTIDDHMSKIQTSLNDHLQSEMQRKEASEERVRELKSKLQAMENETLGLKEKLNQEHNNAHSDVLTNIPNRLAYEEQIKKEIGRARRYQKPMTMAVIDIDFFKKINDRFGHKAGDKVLRAVANVCKENIRDADFLARYGGEEFVLILPETDMEEAGVAVENLRRVVESCNFYHQNQTVLVTVSIGFAELKSDDDADKIFERADMALYSAKRSGRNCCISEMQIEDAA